MKFILFCLFAMTASMGLSQAQDPVKWTVSYHPVSASEGEIVIHAAIDKGWHTYSQRPTDAGPIPTSFTFTPSKNYDTVGSVTESEAHEEFVPAFDAKIFVFTGKAEFRQKISIKAKPGFPVAVKVEYMTCNDMMCLPPKTAELTVKIQ